MEAYTIESAGISLESLMRFYTEDERETLPIPDYQSLRAALDAYSLLTVTDDDGGGVVAAAGYFEYARSSDTCMIYELAGTRVKNTIGRLKGISLQQILIALRVLQVAATEAGPLSLISSARNPRSIGNLSVLGLQEIAPLPTWFEYDTCSWTRMTERPQWKHFVATRLTIDRAISVLDSVGFAAGEFICAASRQLPDKSIVERSIKLIFKLNLRWLFSDIRAGHRRGAFKSLFVDLPSSL